VDSVLTLAVVELATFNWASGLSVPIPTEPPTRVMTLDPSTSKPNIVSALTLPESAFIFKSPLLSSMILKAPSVLSVSSNLIAGALFFKCSLSLGDAVPIPSEPKAVKF
jgi:hypothetical protein